MEDKVVNKIVELLKTNIYGLTITDLVNLSNLSRSSIRTGLAKLEGGKRVKIKQIGMAKVYTLLKK